MSCLQEMDIFHFKLQAYIDTLDVKKCNKYTIKNDMYSDILSVYKKENTNLSSKFKFWARETFGLVHIGSTDLIYVKKNNLLLTYYARKYLLQK
jgi:hypothetical protein